MCIRDSRTGTVIVVVKVLLVLHLGGSQFAALAIEVLEQITGLGSVLQHLLIGDVYKRPVRMS